MAVSMLEEKLAKNLECAICLDTFDDPRMLRCQHTYCRKCLEKIAIRVGSTYKLTCPECREDIKLPRRGVASLQSNFLINELLNLSLNTGVHSNENPPCDKHHEELLELYCEECEEPVCKACLVIDHRDHSYALIKDVFPRIKRGISRLMNEARPKISALSAEVVSIEDEEIKIRDNALAVSQEIDTFIDTLINKQTANLESERRRLKQEVSEKTSLQLSILHDKKEALVVSLSSLEFAKQSLDLECRNKVEFLRSKTEVSGKINELHSLAEDFRPCETVIYKLHNTAPKEENMKELGKITTHSEYCLSMSGGEAGILYTGRAGQWCDFIITIRREESSRSDHRNVMDHFKVTVWKPNGEIDLRSSSLENKGHGSRGFSFRPTCSGDHKISICNEKLFGGEVHGSPFIWKVLPFLQLRSFFCWIRSIGCRDYTYLSDSILEDGQHSWSVRLLVHLEDTRPVHKIGVRHPFRSGSRWYWKNGYRFSRDTCVPSTINSYHPFDVFTCFLDLDQRQLKIYNERTKESDTWRDIEGPVIVYLYPDSFSIDQYFAV